MKLSKLEAYRIYSLGLALWPLIIRFDGDTEKVTEVLDRMWEDHYAHIPKCPPRYKLQDMRAVILTSPLLQKYIQK